MGSLLRFGRGRQKLIAIVGGRFGNYMPDLASRAQFSAVEAEN
jgi:hypothetical protein